MSLSYKISQSYNFQCLLWDTAWLIGATVRFTCAAVRWAAVHTAQLCANALTVSAALCAVLLASVRLLWALGCFVAPIVARWAWAALPWAVGAAGLAGALFVVYAYPVIVGCLLGIACYGAITYPHSKAAQP